jgi:hypothetical protein
MSTPSESLSMMTLNFRVDYRRVTIVANTRPPVKEPDVLLAVEIFKILEDSIGVATLLIALPV